MKEKKKVEEKKTMWIELSTRSKVRPASFNECTKGVMYHPARETITDNQFPLFDFYCKNGACIDTGVPIPLTGFQLSVEKGPRVITLTSVKDLYKRLKIDINDKVKVDYIYCGHPKRIQDVRIILPSKESIQNSQRYVKETDVAYNSRINELLLLRDIVKRDWTFWIAEMPDNYKLEIKSKKKNNH